VTNWQDSPKQTLADMVAAYLAQVNDDPKELHDACICLYRLATEIHTNPTSISEYLIALTERRYKTVKGSAVVCAQSA
jgi:hypothetical protein